MSSKSMRWAYNLFHKIAFKDLEFSHHPLSDRLGIQPPFIPPRAQLHEKKENLGRMRNQGNHFSLCENFVFGGG